LLAKTEQGRFINVLNDMFAEPPAVVVAVACASGCAMPRTKSCAPTVPASVDTPVALKSTLYTPALCKVIVVVLVPRSTAPTVSNALLSKFMLAPLVIDCPTVYACSITTIFSTPLYEEGQGKCPAPAVN
jgi:hypothetical protein